MSKPFYSLVFPLIPILLLSLTPVRAQSSWQAWLYDRASGTMTLVHDDGSAEAHALPVTPGFDILPDRVAVGHGGGTFAYTVVSSTNHQAQLVVARPGEAAPVFTFELLQRQLDSLMLTGSEDNFDAEDRTLALGYSLVGGGWEVVIFDVTTGQEVSSLSSDNPLVTVLGLPTAGGMTPNVERYTGMQVAFTLVPEGAETPLGWKGYIWNVSSNAITNDIVYPSLDNDTLPTTGEVVTAMPDDRLPNMSSNFAFFQSNSLHVYSPTQNARFPFYAIADLSFTRPRFVQNGERILTEVSDATGTFTWQLIERSGALAGTIAAPPSVYSIEGLPDGFIYTTDAANPGVTTLVYVNTRDGLDAGFPVWTSATGAVAQIMWANGNAQFAAQTALSGWPQLAAPVTGTGAPLEGIGLDAGGGQPVIAPGELPTPAPVPGGILTVGGQATIHTTEGDTLNVRSGPGTEDYEVIAQLPDGTRVTIIEGPRTGDGYTWWRIRAPGGTEGWVVESVDDRGTRLQTLLP